MGIVMALIYVLLVGVLWGVLPGWRRDLALAERQLLVAHREVRAVAPIVRQRARTAEFLIWQVAGVIDRTFDITFRALAGVLATAIVRLLGGRFYVRFWALPLMRALFKGWHNAEKLSRERGVEK